VLMLVTPSGSERFAFLATAPGNADGAQQVRRHTPSDVAAQSRDEIRTVNSPVSRLSQADQKCMRLYIAGAIRPEGGNPAIKQRLPSWLRALNLNWEGKHAIDRGAHRHESK